MIDPLVSSHNYSDALHRWFCKYYLKNVWFGFHVNISLRSEPPVCWRWTGAFEEDSSDGSHTCLRGHGHDDDEEGDEDDNDDEEENNEDEMSLWSLPGHANRTKARQAERVGGGTGELFKLHLGEDSGGVDLGCNAME